MPRVKFITTGHSHLAGNFSAGDTFTGGEAECRHFVEDARCAVWDDEKVAPAGVQAPAKTPKAAKSPPARASRQAAADAPSEQASANGPEGEGEAASGESAAH